MKWKSEFTRSATGEFGAYSHSEQIMRIIGYLECFDDLIDAIDTGDAVNRSWLYLHSRWLNEELTELNGAFNEERGLDLNMIRLIKCEECLAMLKFVKFLIAHYQRQLRETGLD